MATTSLDLSKIKGNIISGLAEDEIKFMEELIQNDLENPDNISDQFTGFNLEKKMQFESFLDFLNSDDRKLTTEEVKEIEDIGDTNKVLRSNVPIIFERKLTTGKFKGNTCEVC